MNIYSYLIIITIIFSYLLNLITDLINIKNLQTQVPNEFKEVYSEADYKKSQLYTKSRSNFGILTESIDLVVFLTFWFLGGFNFIDEYARSFGFDDIISGIIFFGIIIIAKFIIDLPFGIYSTFVIEEKFGFNKTTIQTYVLDILKSSLLSIILGVPILYLVIYFFQYFGSFAWIYVWIAITLFSLIITYIAPTYIMPLFNKFNPLEEGELKDLIFAFAEKVNYPLKKIFIMDGSKRSTKSNAYFTGFGNNKRIVLFDTLVEKHTKEELLTVLAHEIGHNKKKHILKNMIISIAQTGFILFLLGLFINNQGLHQAFYMTHISVYASLIFFSMIFSPIGEIISIAFNILSRKYEFEADEFAVKNTNLYKEFISALKKLSVTNLSNLTPHPLYVFLNYSHPPVLDRINRIYELERINEIK